MQTSPESKFTKGRAEVLPCPFCGGDASVEEFPAAVGVSFSVGCDSEDEAACMGYQSFTSFSTRAEAIAAWNKRAPALSQSTCRTE